MMKYWIVVIVALLVGAGLYLRFVPTEEERFSQALKRGDVATAEKYIHHVNLNQTDTDNIPPVFVAIQNKDCPMLRMLLAHGADPSVCEYWSGLRPLHWVIGLGYSTTTRNMVLALLQAGAKVDETDNYTQTALCRAAGEGDSLMVQLLLQHHANINGAGPNNTTPLIEAAKYNQTTVIRMLLTLGADKARKDSDNRTALDNARHWNYQQAIQLLQ